MARPVALVTGAAHRVGRALAVGLAHDGFDIAAHYHSSASKMDDAIGEMTAAGVDARPFQADLAAAEGAAQVIGSVMRAYERLDVLVNSAAIMVRMPFGDVGAADWDSVLALNLRAPFLLAQEAARHLPDGGSIINIADLAAYETWPGYIPHGVSKSGIVYLTRALARVLAPRLRVNAIAPGTVLLPEDFDPKAATHLTATTPLQRDGSPDDVVQAMRYLLHATYVTGETIIVDGGRHVRY